MTKQIYLLFCCNSHKNHSSMRLLLATAKEKKIREEIVRQIKEGDMKYGADISDIKQKPLLTLNNCLEYGYINAVTDGEIQ